VPGSIRRTTTIDSTRPGEILGDVVQFATGRDLYTALDGAVTVLAEATVETLISYSNFYSLTAISSTPDRRELQALVGRSVSTGFRAAMVDAVPDEHERATLLHLLLDDLPGAALVSGYAIGAAGQMPERKPGQPVLQIEGLCAGFQAGGTIMNEVNAERRPPVVTGPVATSLVPGDDLDAWHELRQMGPHDMRRWRCLDLIPGGAGEPARVEIYFRDSHMSPEGLETVVHEYTVLTAVDINTHTIVASGVTAHTLPWLECIEAEASGDRLVGRSLRGLRQDVRQEFVGITTCTHLNDSMRSLEDVRALIPLLA